MSYTLRFRKNVKAATGQQQPAAWQKPAAAEPLTSRGLCRPLILALSRPPLPRPLAAADVQVFLRKPPPLEIITKCDDAEETFFTTELTRTSKKFLPHKTEYWIEVIFYLNQ